MSWRRGGRKIGWLLGVMALISAGAWLVLWGYGEPEMAAYPLVIAVITFSIGLVLLSLTVVRPSGPRVVRTYTVVRKRPVWRPRRRPAPPDPQAVIPAYPDFPKGGIREDLNPEMEAMMQGMLDRMARDDLHSPPELTIVNEEAYYYETEYRPDTIDEGTMRFTEQMGHWEHDMSKAMDKSRRIKRKWKYP